MEEKETLGGGILREIKKATQKSTFCIGGFSFTGIRR